MNISAEFQFGLELSAIAVAAAVLGLRSAREEATYWNIPRDMRAVFIFCDPIVVFLLYLAGFGMLFALNPTYSLFALSTFVPTMVITYMLRLESCWNVGEKKGVEEA